MIKTFSKEPSGESLRRIPCNICGSKDFKSHYSIDGAEYVKCRNCGLVFQNPQPVEEDLANRYDDQYFSYEIENEEIFYNLARMGLTDIHFDSCIDRIRSMGPFLDVGCATGYLLNVISQKGLSVEGVEICPESAAFASERGGFPVYTDPLEKLALKADSYGAVHLSHVIEHLNDPSGFCSEVFRVLAPGGYFILTTPNIAGFQSRLLGAKWRSAIPDHLFLFSKLTIKRLLEKSGFELLDIKTWGGLASGLVPGILKRVADRIVKPLNAGDVMILLLKKPDIR